MGKKKAAADLLKTEGVTGGASKGFSKYTVPAAFGVQQLGQSDADLLQKGADAPGTALIAAGLNTGMLLNLGAGGMIKNAILGSTAGKVLGEDVMRRGIIDNTLGKLGLETSPLSRKILTGAIKGTGEGAVLGSAMQGVNIMAEHMAGVNPEPYSDQNMKDVWQSGLSMAAVQGVMGGAMHPFFGEPKGLDKNGNILFGRKGIGREEAEEPGKIVGKNLPPGTDTKPPPPAGPTGPEQGSLPLAGGKVRTDTAEEKLQAGEGGDTLYPPNQGPAGIEQQLSMAHVLDATVIDPSGRFPQWLLEAARKMGVSKESLATLKDEDLVPLKAYVESVWSPHDPIAKITDQNPAAALHEDALGVKAQLEAAGKWAKDVKSGKKPEETAPGQGMIHAGDQLDQTPKTDPARNLEIDNHEAFDIFATEKASDQAA